MTQPQALPQLPLPVLRESRRTATWGGIGIIIAGALAFIESLWNLAPNTMSALGLEPGSWTPVRLTAAVILAAAAIVLAFGLAGESGIVGRARVGQIALVTYGASGLLYALMVFVPRGQTVDTFIVPSTITSALFSLGIIAVIVSAIVVARAGVLRGAARWALIVPAAWSAFRLAFETSPYPFSPAMQAIGHSALLTQIYVTLFAAITTMLCALQILVGVSFVLYGRAGRTRHQDNADADADNDNADNEDDHQFDLAHRYDIEPDDPEPTSR